MKNIHLISYLAIASIILIFLSSCSKDDPVIEIDQEEYNAAQIIFAHGHFEDDVFIESDEEIVIDFAKDGTPSSNHTHLTEGESYRMKINLFNNGENINQEIIEEAEEHQFFFLGAPEGVFDYVYEDDQIGLRGILSVQSHSETFDFSIILRHGLNKSHSAAQLWNNPEHIQAGGADDLNFTLALHAESEEGGHDH